MLEISKAQQHPAESLKQPAYTPALMLQMIVGSFQSQTRLHRGLLSFDDTNAVHRSKTKTEMLNMESGHSLNFPSVDKF